MEMGRRGCNLPGAGHYRSDRRGTAAFRPDRPSADQGRGAPDRLVGTEAAARVSCGEPITPFRTANSPTETFRILPQRIRQRLPSPVRFPAKRGAECRGFSEPTARRRSQGDWLAEAPVSSEPVSGRKFPAIRENNRESCRFRRWIIPKKGFISATWAV